MFTFEFAEKVLAQKSLQREHYGIIEAASPIKMISKIAKMMPEDTTNFLVFTSGRIDFKELSNAMTECWELPVTGGICDAIGDTRESYKDNRALVIFLNNDKPPMLQKIDNIKTSSASMIFTALGDKDKEIEFSSDYEVFGTDLYRMFYNGEEVPSDKALILPQQRIHLKRSTIHNGKPEDYRTDFIELLESSFLDWAAYFIITCISRVQKMGDDNLDQLEIEKRIRFSDKQGFGIGGLGVYFTDENKIVRRVGKTLGLMKC